MRTTRNTLLSTLGAVMLVALVPAATLAAQAADGGPAGVDWRLTSLLVNGALSPVPDDVEATLRLEEGQASGSTGCNTFGGGYTLEGAGLTFQSLFSSLRLCEEPQGAVEGPYLEVLPLVAAWTIEADGVLRLIDGEGQVVAEYSAVEPGPAGESAIEGVTWLLTEQAADGTLTALPTDLLVSMRLEGGAAGGAGGCNSWFASYTLAGDLLAFADIGSTLIACDEPANTVERTFFANLEATASFAVTDTGLMLASTDGTILLVFVADEPGSLVGSWVATGINIDGGVVSSASTSAVTAEFTKDGGLSGSDGCNTYNSSYRTDGQTIEIDPLATTKMACANDELSEQAAAYGEALPAAVTWSVEPDGILHLRDADGALLVSYEPAAG